MDFLLDPHPAKPYNWPINWPSCKLTANEAIQGKEQGKYRIQNYKTHKVLAVPRYLERLACLSGVSGRCTLPPAATNHLVFRLSDYQPLLVAAPSRLPPLGCGMQRF